MTDHILQRAKAYAVVVGLIVTYLLGEIPVDTRWHQILVLVGGLATVVATHQIPNATTQRAKARTNKKG